MLFVMLRRIESRNASPHAGTLRFVGRDSVSQQTSTFKAGGAYPCEGRPRGET